MMQAVRDALTGISFEPGSTHTGLWLDKFLPEQEVKDAGSGSNGNPRTVHYKRVVELGISKDYRAFFTRWQRALQALGARMRTARVKTRMVVGLGAESVMETAIALHRTYGVPYIPGSALKGLAATFARKYLGWDTQKEDYQILFGTVESAGYVTFFDALYVPGSTQKDRPLALDMITVHHPDYYQGKSAPPADWDNPTPVSFVTAQGKYLLALAGPADWVDVAFHILGLALEQEGVGAKTAIGYGRLTVSSPDDQDHPQSDATSVVSKKPAGTPQQQEEQPSKHWPWRKGRIDKTGRYVIDLQDPNKRYRFDRAHVLPKGYTPPRKAEVEFVVRQRPDGTRVVWVKKKYHILSE